ncbi:MAG TPA: Ig-like domain-containing protein [Gemmatimonadaceae bacterium]
MPRRLIWLPLCLIACGENPAALPSPKVATVVVSPGSAAIYPSVTTQLTAVLTDSLGDTLTGHAIAWSTSDPLIATVDTTGLVTGTGGGTAVIVATSEGHADTASIAVTAAKSIVVDPTIIIVPTLLRIVPGGSVQLRFLALDSLGDSLPGYPLALASSDTNVAMVTPAGLVTGRAPGITTVTATNGVLQAQIHFAVRTVTFVSVEASEFITGCGLTADNAAFCWGDYYGQGAGIRQNSLSPIGVAFYGKMMQVTSGDGFSCGLSDAGVAYCWGWNSVGRLGYGSPLRDSYVPVPVAGGHVFVTLSSGSKHTCALTAAGDAWCWGDDEYGALGDGPPGGISTSPVAVAGGLQFRLIAAGGYNNTCGVAVDSSAYCWGNNDFGQVGSGDSLGAIFVPTLVAGALKFRMVVPGWTHSCGIAVDGAAYCWGNNHQGELGTGDTSNSRVPRPVAGGFSFVEVGIGGSGADEFTCGVTTAGIGLCWGENQFGQLGNGTTTATSTPTPVSGGLAFVRITAGSDAGCGIATSGTTYCWGYGRALGNGTGIGSLVPVRVAGQP